MFPVRRHGVALAIVSVATIALAATAAAAPATYSAPIGGPGGNAFTARCRQAADVLTGFDYTAGKAMDSITPVCTPMASGTRAGNDYRLAKFGGEAEATSSFAVRGTARCPANHAIVALDVSVDRHGEIHHVRAVCRPVSSGGQGTILAATDTAGGEVAYQKRSSCPSGFRAVGLAGASGTLIDSLGLVCGEVTPAAVATPAPPAPADSNRPVKLTGRGRTVRLPTTVYDKPEGNEIGYLVPGQLLATIQCPAAPAWCSISAPQEGWVWGGDLWP